MNVKSFHLNGLQVDIRAEKLPESMMRLIVFINGNEVGEAPYHVSETELDMAVTNLEQSFRDNLTV